MGLEATMIQMKVMNALRDPGGPGALQELEKTYNIAEFPSLLLAAVEDAPLTTIRYVIQLYLKTGRSVNETDEDGNTPLHVAIKDHRRDVAVFLLGHPEVDDTIANKKGVLPADLATDSRMEAALSNAQHQFTAAMALRLRQAFMQRNLPALEKIYSTPRVHELLNINGQDPDTGSTVLHDAAAGGDLKLVQFILAHGGDPLAQNAQGKIPGDVAHGETVVRALNQAAKSNAILAETKNSKPGVASAPEMAGYLKKWTNFSSGYKLRWFQLRNGTLSYYKQRDDAKSERNVRGSIALRHAHVRLDSSEKNKFEVRTANTKFHLKAAHPAETSRWVWSLQNAITYAKDYDKKHHRRSNSVRSNVSTESHRVNTPTGLTTTAIGSTAGSTAGSAAASLSSPVSPTGNPVIPPVKSDKKVDAKSDVKPKKSLDLENSQGESSSSGGITFFNDLNVPNDDDDDNDSSDEEFDLDETLESGPPISIEGMIARVAAIRELLTLLLPQTEEVAVSEAIVAAQTSLEALASDLERYQKRSKYFDVKHTNELERSDKAQRQWASNYRDLEIQYEKIARQLESLRPKEEDSDDEFFDAEGAFDNTGIVPSNQATTNASQASTNDETQLPPSHSLTDSTHPHRELSEAMREAQAQVPETIEEEPELKGSQATSSGQDKSSDLDTGAEQQALAEPKPSAQPIPPAQQHPTTDIAAAAGVGAGAGAIAEAFKSTGDSQTMSTDQADNSAEAHSGKIAPATTGPEAKQQQQKGPNGPSTAGTATATRPGTKSGTETQNTGETKTQSEKQQLLVNQNSWAGYEDPPRQKLKIDADNRPKMSLWGILKNLIGKDMTKMTLPVTFNECTSLLQRSTEDMEYTDLLDKAAAAVSDPGLRMAYIAAFAGSSYSSTINRVAKPFNPLLGETYEYARPDKGYRLFAEQVSHHPPIGALIAESKRWDFYGESNVESKFYGRSFDINPLGLWYLNLRPDSGAGVDDEVYSFRKITSSVVGIMIGNPTVDNYGTMTIVNHTLGITAEIEYKPRGWRASSAYKLSGIVKDSNGKELWAIKGQWNQEISARKIGSSGGEGDPIKLWEVHPRHPAPFNLTSFAITLNALPDKLIPWLPPTDTRLRPDQRAMEEGRYDDASDEKSRVEDKQRKARKLRETEGITYKPQWFTIEKHPVTGMDYYKPTGEYWARRAGHQLADSGDIF